ncbi:MAG: indole-3-glycerol phosphate synthase TrpC [Thermodesulfobacteriota bacterium]|nr:indole-3-glycerol phosphate synthase TrpC [Thermodesulfobacteriota bacterium]
MTDILTKIVTTKAEEIAAALSRLPLDDLKEMAEDRDDYRHFTRALRQTHDTGTGIIAEIKRASPSKGEIRANLDPAAYARKYEQGGATAISVLTDATYFKGAADDLKAARAAASLPVLRKDFLISDYQVYESAVMGADAVLLIVRILTPAMLSELIDLSRTLHLDTLVEVHDEKDLETATAAGAELIGINNRDLKTFKTDIRVAARLVGQLTSRQIPVAASGIANAKDIQQTRTAGINNFLIGESLVRADDTVAFLKTLTNREHTPANE